LHPNPYNSGFAWENDASRQGISVHGRDYEHEGLNMAKKREEVVVITGASAGVGRASAREFGRHGAAVGLIARNRARLETAQKEIEGAGGRALVLPLDVADPQAMDHAAERVERELGPIDIWINDAMTSVFSPIDQMKPEEFKRVTEVTYLGFVYGTLSALKRMQLRDGGTIVQVGSALAYRSIPLQAAYCAAKHAMVGFTDSLRCELIHQNSHIQVTVVHMPALNTPQFGWVKSRLPHKAQPVPPIFQPEVAARAIYWAAHHHRRELWVGASTAAAIVGQKFIPGLLDRYLGKTGYASQQYDGAEDPNRPNNLWESVPGDYAAHGRFDDRASETSTELWMGTHPSWLMLGGAAFVAGALYEILFGKRDYSRARLLRRAA
jgi:NAD(P)-dependent dehydrogenase (short-subunit alcohol dehydrogenase family)